MPNLYETYKPWLPTPKRFTYTPPKPKRPIAAPRGRKGIPPKKAKKVAESAKVFYQDTYKPPTLDTSQLVAMQEAYRRQLEERNRIAGVDQANRGAAGVGGGLVTYQPDTDAYGRPLKHVDPALLERIMSSPPGHRVTFNEMIPRAGEEYQRYMMEQGVVPHFGAPSSITNIHSGRWTDYLLGRLGITQYGVNPYASPYPQQPAQPAGAGGGGGAGGAGGGYGGRGTVAETKPKQYGSVRTQQGRNVPQWLMDMVVWNI